MRNIFVLTKREQRVVILIMVILVVAALANHYREKWRDSTVRSASPESSTTPALSPVQRENNERGEGP